MASNGSIHVINRSGVRVPLSLSEISERLNRLIEMEPKLNISADFVAIKTASALIDNIKTSEIDMISANICAGLIVEDYEYDTLAARIMISNLHSMISGDLREYADSLRSYKYRDMNIEILHPKVIAFIKENVKDLHRLINYNADYQYNYFGVITLMNSYLLAHKFDNDVKIIKERPQQMLLRVAIGIHMNMINDLGECDDETFDSISTTYELLSERYYTHATPTLFNAGTINHTLSSCYLLAIDDNLGNIYSRLSDISKISKFSGGVGIHVSQVRAAGSVIGSTIGRSQGLVPMLRVYNESTRYVSQGGGKRKGSTAVYIEPWHSDIESCLASQKQQGTPETLCRDLFLAIWMPDLFMERLKIAIKSESGTKPIMWSLMCPNECKGLTDVYGDEFKYLYESYEKAGKFVKQIPIISLWNLITSTQIETGKPYIMYKDHVNRKCNQSNLGVIKSSNLCVHGDTKILTKDGYQTINTIAEQFHEVWNGTEWAIAKISKTNSNQKLLKVVTDDGCELKCTYYHKFHVLVDGEVVIKQAKDLHIDDELVQYDLPITEHRINRDTLIKVSKLSPKFNTQNDEQTMIIEDSLDNLQELLMDLQSIGIRSRIIPSDEHIKTLYVNPNDTYRMCILMENLGIQIDGFNQTEPKRANIEKVKISSIALVHGNHDTYCFNEPNKHLGMLNGMHTGNCSEITLYTDEQNIGVCNLASVCLPKFVNQQTKEFDYKKLYNVMQIIVYNMNRVMDNNKYPLDQAKYSDDQNRPIGIGTQGLAEVFMMMREPFDSPKSREVNRKIFETMHFAALTASNKLAQVHGTYKTFSTSLTARGILQPDLWKEDINVTFSGMWDWESLRSKIVKTGLRNSLLMAQMPTAGTSIIMEHTESVEVPQSNVFTRSTLSGRFQVVNKYLMKDLKQLGLWTTDIRNKIIQNDGSILNIIEIPERIREIYKTVYEYKLSHIIEMSADREAYICQASSNNRYIVDPSIAKLTKMHLFSWQKGLKTSSYYVRCKQLTTGKKLLIAPKKKERPAVNWDAEIEECAMCTA